MRKKPTFVLILTLILSMFSIPTGAYASDEVYKETVVTKGENLNLESTYPELGVKLREQLGDKYDQIQWNSVTETKTYFTLDENNELDPVTIGEIGLLSCGAGENNCSNNYGITLYAVGGDYGSGQKIFAGRFLWDNNPPLDAGKSVDGFTLNWAGNLAITDYHFYVEYNNTTDNFSPSVITPNQGIGFEFREAIDRTWPASNRYAVEGGGYAIVNAPTSNLGRSANVVATYLHTSSTTTINSIGISIDGGSIGWNTTTTVQSVAALDTFTY